MRKRVFRNWSKKQHEGWRKRFPDELVFIEKSSYPRHRLKKRIIEDKLIEYKCAICNCEAIWLGKPLVLILDHINGVNNDNRLSNLRFVCSNCESQLPTYKKRNWKNVIQTEQSQKRMNRYYEGKSY